MCSPGSRSVALFIVISPSNISSLFSDGVSPLLHDVDPSFRVNDAGRIRHPDLPELLSPSRKTRSMGSNPTYFMNGLAWNAMGHGCLGGSEGVNSCVNPA
jgi:hypothetical protein